MANIKSIVKVMNFQALLHVDSAHRTADKYLLLEKDVGRMIDIIENNRNMILDKKSVSIDKNAPRLRIFVGSDLGFCGIINASVNKQLMREDGKNDIIIIGRKIHTNYETKLSMTRDEFEDRYSEIKEYFVKAVVEKKYSGIDVFYNRYHNMTHIEPTTQTIFPLAVENDEEEDLYKDDFMIEGGDPIKILEQLTITYLNYEMKSIVVNSYASENILRQQATNESLKHIDEIEAQEKWEQHKHKEQVAVNRVIESYTKTKYKEQ